MFLNCGVGEDSWESLGLQGDPTSPFWWRSALGFLWKEWCWSWNSSTLATSCEELTHWQRLWCWEGLGAGGEGDDRRWDGWMTSLTRWTWVWVNSRSWWWTGRPGMLRFMGSQRVGHDWATELNWTEAHVLVPGSGRSPVEGNANLFRYSCLENPDRSLASYSPLGRKELNMTEQVTERLSTNASLCLFLILCFRWVHNCRLIFINK